MTVYSRQSPNEKNGGRQQRVTAPLDKVNSAVS